MKVIITGPTGFVGSAVLSACISDPSITSIIALSRRALPASMAAAASTAGASGGGSSSSSGTTTTTTTLHPKVRVVIVEDFSTLATNAEVLEACKDADACLWCIGGRHTQTSRWKTGEEYRAVSVGYTVGMAEGVLKVLREGDGRARKMPFRFVFCSGHAAELDGGKGKRLWVMGETRRVKGIAEQSLFDLADANPGLFEAYTVRPCFIYQKEPDLVARILTSFSGMTCHVEELATAMVEVAKKGHEGRIVDKDEIRRMAKTAEGGKA